jgi:hypothetical protein
MMFVELRQQHQAETETGERDEAETFAHAMDQNLQVMLP